jgi:hypothetical protein
LFLGFDEGFFRVRVNGRVGKGVRRCIVGVRLGDCIEELGSPERSS